MKTIQSVNEVEDVDRIYLVMLTNKSTHYVPFPVANAMSKLESGTIVKLPSGDFINKSHIVEMFWDKKETARHIRKSELLCNKYGIQYIAGRLSDYIK